MSLIGRENNKDGIQIDNLEVFAHHGVFPEEQRDGQNFYVNATLYTDIREAGEKDDLECSTNYGEVCHFIHSFLQEHTWKLIESVAEQLAEAILQTFDRIDGLVLEIRKPSAPIGLPFESVSVKICRGWHTAYIALGSNMGEKQQYLDSAIEKLGQSGRVRVKKVSSWIVTKPYGGVEQDDFLNGVAEIETMMKPDELLAFLHVIEAEAQRTREIHWGPRTLDLDILFYEDLVLDSENLTIPHPDLQNRDFVLKPMCEIAPWVRHPIRNRTVREMWKKLEIKDEI